MVKKTDDLTPEERKQKRREYNALKKREAREKQAVISLLVETKNRDTLHEMAQDYGFDSLKGFLENLAVSYRQHKQNKD